MKNLILTIVTTFLTLLTFATTVVVSKSDNYYGNLKSFTDLQNALNFANTNDTVLILDGKFKKVYLTKKLFLKGSNAENNNTSLSAKIYHFASGSVIEDIESLNSIESDVANLVIKNSTIKSLKLNNSTKSILFDNCEFTNFLNLSGDQLNSLTFESCVFNQLPKVNNGVFNNCLFKKGVNSNFSFLVNCKISNSVFTDQITANSFTIFDNCIFQNEYPKNGLITNSVVAVTFEDVFENYNINWSSNLNLESYLTLIDESEEEEMADIKKILNQFKWHIDLTSKSAIVINQ